MKLSLCPWLSPPCRVTHGGWTWPPAIIAHLARLSCWQALGAETSPHHSRAQQWDAPMCPGSFSSASAPATFLLFLVPHRFPPFVIGSSVAGGPRFPAPQPQEHLGESGSRLLPLSSVFCACWGTQCSCGTPSVWGRVSKRVERAVLPLPGPRPSRPTRSQPFPSAWCGHRRGTQMPRVLLTGRSPPQVIIVIYLSVVGALLLYMTFLMLVDPLIRKPDAYTEQLHNEEENEVTGLWGRTRTAPLGPAWACVCPVVPRFALLLRVHTSPDPAVSPAGAARCPCRWSRRRPACLLMSGTSSLGAQLGAASACFTAFPSEGT